MILSDLFITARQMVAEVAAEVGEVAHQVETAAEDLGHAVMFDNLTLEGVQEKGKEALSEVDKAASDVNVRSLGDESFERARDIFIGRLQEVCILHLTRVFFLTHPAFRL